MANLLRLLTVCTGLLKRHLIFIILMMLLTGCTSVSLTVRETQGHLNQWVDQPVHRLIDRNGLPDAVIRMDNKSISHIKTEIWDSSYGLFSEIDTKSVQQWNDQISAWVLLYRYEEQRLDGNYYACTQTYRINSRGIIIEVKEGWTSPDNQNPCYIRYKNEKQRIMVARSQIKNH